MGFCIYTPSELLKPYVKQYAIHETDVIETYKVLPDSHIVLGIQYKGRLVNIDGETSIALSTAGITGLQDRYRIFQNSAHIGTILVYFTVTGAAHFLRHPLHLLFNGSFSLEDVWPKFQRQHLTEQLAEAGDDLSRIQRLEAFLVHDLCLSHQDTLVTHAATYMQQTQGQIRISELAKHYHLSQSQFEKRFRKTIGASPKKFASILRLRSIIHFPTPVCNLTELAYQAGYFDQAHFIKDFKAFTGSTPSQFFKS